jgi:hypothetical protein
MVSKHITAKDAIEALRKVTAERGENYIDPGSIAGFCVYVNAEGGSECAVGKAFQDHLGIKFRENLAGSISTMAANLARDEEVRANFVATYFENIDDLTMTQGAEDVFRAYQRWQDGGGEYGEALDKAETAYRVVLIHEPETVEV